MQEINKFRYNDNCSIWTFERITFNLVVESSWSSAIVAGIVKSEDYEFR